MVVQVLPIQGEGMCTFVHNADLYRDINGRA